MMSLWESECRGSISHSPAKSVFVFRAQTVSSHSLDHPEAAVLGIVVLSGGQGTTSTGGGKEERLASDKEPENLPSTTQRALDQGPRCQAPAVWHSALCHISYSQCPYLHSDRGWNVLPSFLHSFIKSMF